MAGLETLSHRALLWGDQPAGNCNDLPRRPVIAVDDMNLNVAIFVREIQDEAYIRRPEGIERLVIVSDRPKLHARRHEPVDEFDLPGVDVLILIEKDMLKCPGDGRWNIQGCGPLSGPPGAPCRRVDGTGLANGVLVDAEESTARRSTSSSPAFAAKLWASRRRSFAPPMISRMSVSSFHHIRRELNT